MSSVRQVFGCDVDSFAHESGTVLDPLGGSHNFDTILDPMNGAIVDDVVKCDDKVAFGVWHCRVTRSFLANTKDCCPLSVAPLLLCFAQIKGLGSVQCERLSPK